MKMAKEQSLFLNPLKFSGICGKLMCCLKYEYPTYKEAKSRLPATGAIVSTSHGSGKVVEVNVIKETFNIELEGGAVAACTIHDLIPEKRECPTAEGSCNGCGAQAEMREPARDAEAPDEGSAPVNGNMDRES
jgi:cell fate regulator YaaT (PSP1 superfamily)